jgi:hypothetical protein
MRIRNTAFNIMILFVFQEQIQLQTIAGCLSWTWPEKRPFGTCCTALVEPGSCLAQRRKRPDKGC